MHHRDNSGRQRQQGTATTKDNKDKGGRGQEKTGTKEDEDDSSRGSRPTLLEPQILYVFFITLYYFTLLTFIYQILRDDDDEQAFLAIRPPRTTDNECDNNN
jgi:hypothetical protein